MLQIDNNLAAQWFWALWESAQFCVLAKLRTPLGKPQETFTTIEAALKAYASALKTRRQNGEVQHNNNKGKESEEQYLICVIGIPCTVMQLKT